MVNKSRQARPERRHVLMDQFTVKDNCLLIGGRLITELAEEVGDRPFYAYDRSVIERQVNALRSALPSEIRLHYAVKANPMPALVRFLSELADGLDVASAGELATAMAAGIPASAISFAGPGKTDRELAAAIDAGIILCLESEGEMRRLAALASSLGLRPRVAVRVNPDFQLRASGMKMGGGAQPFGVDAEKVPRLLESLSTLPLEFRGFHIFSGSQNLQAESICEAQRRIFALAAELADSAPAPVRWLNIGGGLGVPYFPGDQRIPLDPIGKNLESLLEERPSSLAGAEIIMELGRFLVAEAGVYVCRVIDRKVSRGKVFLVTDGGLNHNLAASGNFGQVIRKNYPICIGNRVECGQSIPVSVVGPLCTPLDVLGDNIELPEAMPGDLVVVFQSGAYGFSASPRDFLGHPQPEELLV